VPEDEDLRIEALRQELMREVDSVKNETNSSLNGLRKDIGTLKWLLLALIAVFSLIMAILASAANII
jgi:hypothetical protein